jgi:Do/DeqQ family serine protease
MNRFFMTVGCALAMEVAAFAQNPTPATPAQDLARSLSKSFADVYEHVSPGVVVIEAKEAQTATNYPMASPLGQFFGAAPTVPGDRDETNQGSGFIITADGYILTNNHVLEGASADGLVVTLTDGRKMPAKIVGEDPTSDLAVIKIDATNLPALDLGDSDKTRVGEFAFALGAPYDLRNTFTYGIVSAKGRTDITGSENYEEYIQTDASINPGNSGGPLVDIDGRVIGVNTLIRDLNRGLGFAIPINIAKKVAMQLIANGRASRPWLGIWIKSVDDFPGLTDRFPDLPKGIIVMGIQNGTPAALSELRRNDIITSVDGTPVTNARELQKAILDKKIGQEIELKVWRNERIVRMKLRTAEHTEGIQPVVNQRFSSPVNPNLPGPADEDETDGDAQDTPPQADTAPAPPSPSAGLMVRPLKADAALAMKLQGEDGLLVTSVQPGSAAAAAGVQVGDVITSVGSTPVRTKEDLLKALDSASGGAVMLNLNRGDQKTYEILKR